MAFFLSPPLSLEGLVHKLNNVLSLDKVNLSKSLHLLWQQEMLP